MVTFTESFLLLLRCARVASCHSAFMSNCPDIVTCVSRIYVVDYFFVFGVAEENENLPRLFLPHFLHDFWRKIFILLYSIIWPNIIFCLPLPPEILGIINIRIVYWPDCDIICFEINFIFPTKPFFSIQTKSQDKNLHILRTKRSFKMKQKSLFVTLKRLSLNFLKERIRL